MVHVGIPEALKVDQRTQLVCSRWQRGGLPLLLKDAGCLRSPYMRSANRSRLMAWREVAFAAVADQSAPIDLVFMFPKINAVI